MFQEGFFRVEKLFRRMGKASSIVLFLVEIPTVPCCRNIGKSSPGDWRLEAKERATMRLVISAVPVATCRRSMWRAKWPPQSVPIPTWQPLATLDECKTTTGGGGGVKQHSSCFTLAGVGQVSLPAFYRSVGIVSRRRAHARNTNWKP